LTKSPERATLTKHINQQGGQDGQKSEEGESHQHPSLLLRRKQLCVGFPQVEGVP
jgi:hypothetical protein